MPSVIAAPAKAVVTRHRLRLCAEQCGVPCGPRPAGARLLALLWDGTAISGDVDVTIRHGDQVLLAESPAPGVSTATRRELRRAAAMVAPYCFAAGQAGTLSFALSDDGWVLVEIEDADLSGAPAGMVVVRCCLRVRRVSGLPPAQEPDVITGVSGLQADECRWAVGQRPPAGAELACLLVSGAEREQALAGLRQRLDGLQIGGIAHDGARMRALLDHPLVRAGAYHPALAHATALHGAWLLVERPGMETTVQDWPGRQGYWEVGVPPSGPMDDFSFRLANQAVGNPPGTAGLEMILAGPQLRFTRESVVALAGAPMQAFVNDQPVAFYQPITIPAGGCLRLGGVSGAGLRSYLAIRGGLEVPSYLGSRATFTLGGFGGHAGRPLVAGDELPLATQEAQQALPPAQAIPAKQQPQIVHNWTIAVMYGPHPAPDFLTLAGMEEFLQHTWKVSSQSNRTGVRLLGPKPGWARQDGGEAGLHPSNLHDNGYAIGAVDFTGDTPVMLGPDGPSCGGFACPVVVPLGERWKMGQLRPGDTVQWRLVEAPAAQQLQRQPDSLPTILTAPSAATASPFLYQAAAGHRHPGMVVRQAGDGYVLVEYGPHELDIALRMRVHLLDQRLRQWRRDGALPWLIDQVPGVRSLLVQVDPLLIDQQQAVAAVVEHDQALADDHPLVPTRTLHLPLSWDDPSTRKAIDIYLRTVNPDAPWCPWNIEFIRRINGLDTVEQVREMVFAAEYLVMGLGDVYLGAPLSTPIDPRHRLVTTKYNPARTWTPENAVGIGGAYMCIYGMEGPGGYQFVGRTVPVWNTWRTTPCFSPEAPWLLRQFDRIRWYPVSHEELGDLRHDMRSGQWSPAISDGQFDLASHQDFLQQHTQSITNARTRQQSAFAAERERWAAMGVKT